MEKVPLTDTEVKNRANALTYSKALKLFNGGFVFDANTQKLIDDALAKYNTTNQTNNQNKNPRFFTAFGLDEGEISGNIIDIGGGSGDLRDFCEGKYTNIDIRSSADICLDINEELKSKQIETLMTDKRKNTVVCCDLIEHVLNPQNIFKIANAVLVQGGKFYLNVGQFHTDENIGPFHPPHITSFSKKTIENLCDNFGFAVKRQDTNSFTLEKT